MIWFSGKLGWLSRKLTGGPDKCISPVGRRAQALRPNEILLVLDGVFEDGTWGIQEKRTCSPDDLVFGQAGLGMK